MKIGGFVDISTKDIPHRSAMVIFLVGCNFNCEFCHNKHLLQSSAGRTLKVDEIIGQVKSNLLVSGVSITGGEPTLQSDLPSLCEKIKQTGKYLSVDSNGSNPEMVEKIIHFTDRIALDLKTDPRNAKNYELISGSKIDSQSIIKTINLVKQYKNVEFEIRTTYVDPLISSYEIKGILEFLNEIQFRGNYVIQQYQYSDGVGLEYKEKFHKPEHGKLVNILKKYRENTLPFEIYLRDEIVGYCNIKDLFNFKLDDI